MRTRRATLLFGAIAFVLGGCSSSSSSGETTTTDGGGGGDTLTCAWIGSSNCLTTFVSDVADCLGSTDGATGVMDIDDRTCTYGTSGRVVTFNTALGTTIDGGSPGTKDIHFTVTMSGKTCLEHRETKGDFGFTSIGPKGTFSVSYAGNVATISCPDGSKVSGDITALKKSCSSDYDAKFPSSYWSETTPAFVFKPSTTPIYQCFRLHGGGGGDGGTDATSDASDAG
jgi:hypothetical protein